MSKENVQGLGKLIYSIELRDLIAMEIFKDLSFDLYKQASPSEFVENMKTSANNAFVLADVFLQARETDRIKRESVCQSET